MRIATSTIYAQQTAAIDEQTALYQQTGQNLSTGISLNNPSDDPAHIAQDLQIHTTIDQTTQQGINVQNAVSELATTDSALNSLVSVIQSARQLAIQGATETLTDQQRTAIGNQLDELVQQSVAIGNTSYGGKYVFGGTQATANPPVQQQGNPITGVGFIGNEQEQGQLIYNGQQFALSTTFRAAFNYQASDHSPDVFQTLINLRNTLTNRTATDQSAGAINQAGATVYGALSPAPTTLASVNSFATKPVADNAVPGGAFTIEVHGNDPVTGADAIRNVTVAANAAIDDGTPNSVVGAINAQSAVTGVTAVFNAKTQRIALTGKGTFYVSDVPTPAGALGGTIVTAATRAGNLSTVLNLAPQADFVQNVSTQIGDVDHVLNQTLNARSVIGARIQALTSVEDQLQTAVTDSKSIKSNLEDTNIAAATSKFSQTQTALQAAYSTTTRLESKTLFDYLP